jgi:hypothetical protein
MTTAISYGAYNSNPLATAKALNAAVWLMFAISFAVAFEPAPTDMIFAIVLILFAFLRVEAAVGVLPLLVILVLYNLGGFLSYAHAPAQPKAMMFVVTSAYMAVSAVVLALYVAANPLKHIENIGKAWSIGAVFATVWALIDYFQLPSPLPLQVLPGRATGLFKDPNVFSTYLIFPMIFMLQKLVLGSTKRPILVTLALGFTTIGLFLSFSRGAWANFVFATLMLVTFTFLLFDNEKTRTRLIIYVISGLIFATVAFIVLMSIPQIREMFTARFSLVQSYDAGETGRFGNQVRSIPELLRRPFGYGPLLFGVIYGQAPHNTFVNAFSAYGWLGGITYFLLIISTLYIGVRTIFAKTPWQPLAIAVFCPLVAVIFQGVQIDTEHWRHFYWNLGMMWGLFAITLQPGKLLYVQSEFSSQR